MNNPSFYSKIDLIYPTSHLNGFEDLFEATGLSGNEYVPILKTVWYSLLSTLISTQQLALGKIRVDGRIHIAIFIKSGRGKTEIKNTMEKILEGVGKKYIEPTSLHPEQLVGKVRIERDKEGERTYEKIPGHLSLDYLIIDEGKSLLRSNDASYSEIRRYLRLALDQYPNNKVTKKSVDIEHENALEYSPHCGVSLFVQPYSLSEEIVLEGDFRRFIISYANIGRIDCNKSLLERSGGISNHEESLKNFLEFMTSIKTDMEFEFTQEARKVFDELSVILVENGLQRGGKVGNYVDINAYSIQNTLLKFSVIQALQKNTHIIVPEHVEMAFMDYTEILEHTYNFIENKIIGDMDYGEKWAGAIKKDQISLKWLLTQGSTSEEDSKVSIAEYKEKLMEIFRVDERQARRIKNAHRDKGWIEEKKGQHDSKVWVTTQIEENIRAVSMDRQDIIKEIYIQIVNKVESK